MNDDQYLDKELAEMKKKYSDLQHNYSQLAEKIESDKRAAAMKKLNEEKMGHVQRRKMMDPEYREPEREQEVAAYAQAFADQQTTEGSDGEKGDERAEVAQRAAGVAGTDGILLSPSSAVAKAPEPSKPFLSSLSSDSLLRAGGQEAAVVHQGAEEADIWSHRPDLAPDHHNSPLNNVSDYERINSGNLSRYPNQIEKFNGLATMETAPQRWQGNPQNFSAYSQINPAKPEGLVPQRVDDQYEGVQQLKKPLLWENATDRDDLRNIFNPNKSADPGAYMQSKADSAPTNGSLNPVKPATMQTASNNSQRNQINPAKPSGLVPPPVDPQYEGVPQLKKPLIIENATDKDDFRNVYNPNKLPNLARKPAAAPKMAQETAVVHDIKKQGEKRWEDGFNIPPPDTAGLKDARKKEVTEVNRALTNKVINQK